MLWFNVYSSRHIYYFLALLSLRCKPSGQVDSFLRSKIYLLFFIFVRERRWTILSLISQEKPIRIVNFKILSADFNSVTFSWTAPQDSYGRNGISDGKKRMAYQF